MIERIQLLRNVGQFSNVSPPPQTALTPFSLFYAENGRGKTTLAAILRSLATNDPELVNERKRLGAQHPPHITFEIDGQQVLFQNGAWSQHVSDIAIFDDAFVSVNVCSGIELQSEHRQNLHELILGEQGVALNSTLQGHVRRVEQHNTRLRELSEAIPAAARGPYRVDAFCALEEDADIEQKIKESERRLAAAQSADAVRQRPGFNEISLPDFDNNEIERILRSTLEDVDAAAVEQVQKHIGELGDGGETWVSEGIPRIMTATEEHDGLCPFCKQGLEGVDLVSHYRTYFSDQYNELKATIRATGISIRDTHGKDVPAAFEREILTAVQSHEFWSKFVELPAIEIDTAAIAREWKAAREGVLTHLRAKAGAPLEPSSLSPETLEAIRVYRIRITEISQLSERLLACNARIEIAKEQAAADDLAALSDDLARLQAQKARFSPPIMPHCAAYLTEKTAKVATELLRDQARVNLDQYREQIFPAYETAINDYLRRFAASFRIGEVQSVNNRAGSSASYCVVINQENVNVTAETGTSFRNTLSAGDRNTLALAFFFTSLEKDPNIRNKIVVIDDPMTSLDEHRTLRTREEIRDLASRVQQTIVLSHSKPFLCGLWEQADRNARTALRIGRIRDGSEIATWDVRNDSISEHDKRHELVREYLQVADPDSERKVAEALRPILEAFHRVAFPEHYPPGTLLGPFIGTCERHVGTAQEVLPQNDIDELRSLKNYANCFHHDSNPAWQTELINDAELTDFAERTILFASRR